MADETLYTRYDFMRDPNPPTPQGMSLAKGAIDAYIRQVTFVFDTNQSTTRLA
jgi:hypothetical protein